MKGLGSQGSDLTVKYYVAKNSDQQDQLPAWDALSEESRLIVTRATVSIRKWKFLFLSASSLFLVIQPVFNSIREDRAEARQAELVKTEKASESSLVLQKLLMSNLQEISAQLVAAQIDRESLRQKISTLEQMQIKIQKEKDELEKKIKPGS